MNVETIVTALMLEASSYMVRGLEEKAQYVGSILESEPYVEEFKRQLALAEAVVAEMEAEAKAEANVSKPAATKVRRTKS